MENLHPQIMQIVFVMFLAKIGSLFVFSFWKKGTKALKDSYQSVSNSAVNHGSQSEYPLACLFLKLLKKTINSLRIKLSNLVNYFVARKHIVKSLVLPQASFRN